MWLYSITQRTLTRPDGTVLSRDGYSGHGEGRNNVKMTNVPQIGPLPVGDYDIGKAYHHPHLGVLTMNLMPKAGTNTFGRTLFRIHGNDKINDASHGCLIENHNERFEISESNDKVLRVVA